MLQQQHFMHQHHMPDEANMHSSLQVHRVHHQSCSAVSQHASPDCFLRRLLLQLVKRPFCFPFNDMHHDTYNAVFGDIFHECLYNCTPASPKCQLLTAAVQRLSVHLAMFVTGCSAHKLVSVCLPVLLQQWLPCQRTTCYRISTGNLWSTIFILPT